MFLGGVPPRLAEIAAYITESLKKREIFGFLKINPHPSPIAT